MDGVAAGRGGRAAARTGAALQQASASAAASVARSRRSTSSATAAATGLMEASSRQVAQLHDAMDGRAQRQRPGPAGRRAGTSRADLVVDVFEPAWAGRRHGPRGALEQRLAARRATRRS